MADNEEIKWRCPECDGLNVEAELWVDLNSSHITSQYDKVLGDEGWCHDCEDRYLLEYRIAKVKR